MAKIPQFFNINKLKSDVAKASKNHNILDNLVDSDWFYLKPRIKHANPKQGKLIKSSPSKLSDKANQGLSKNNSEDSLETKVSKDNLHVLENNKIDKVDTNKTEKVDANKSNKVDTNKSEKIERNKTNINKEKSNPRIEIKKDISKDIIGNVIRSQNGRKKIPDYNRIPREITDKVNYYINEKYKDKFIKPKDLPIIISNFKGYEDYIKRKVNRHNELCLQDRMENGYTKNKVNENNEKEPPATEQSDKEDIVEEKSKDNNNSNIIEIPWSCVRFYDGYAYLFHPKLYNQFGKASFRISGNNIKRSFNRVSALFVKRLPNIVVECRNEAIIKIISLPEFWNCIALLDHPSLIPDFDVIDVKGKGRLFDLDKKQVFKLLTEKDKGYIDFLCKKQLDSYKIYYIIEQRINSSNIKGAEEEGFLFVVKQTSYITTLIYENAEISRASIIFDVLTNYLDKAIKFINDFFSSSQVNKRELLSRHKVIASVHGIKSYTHVNHTSVSDWKIKIKKYLL